MLSAFLVTFIGSLAGTVCTFLKSSVYVMNSFCNIAMDVILTLGCHCKMAYWWWSPKSKRVSICMVSGGRNRIACCVGTLSIVQILMFQGKHKNGRFPKAYKLNLSYLHSQEGASFAFTPVVEYRNHSCYLCWAGRMQSFPKGVQRTARARHFAIK